MKKNSTDIMKLREFFQKYGYQTRDKEDSGLTDFHFLASQYRRRQNE